MKIIVAGIIGRYPWGGVTWCSLMYLKGLQQLGHEVYYLEDTCECNYDPEINAIATNPSYALATIDRSLSPFGFGDKWCYVDYTGKHHGMDGPAWREVCRDADLMLVLSGGCWVWRDEYLNIPVKGFIDSDPGFTQLALEQARLNDADERKRWYVDYFKTYDHLFTFGRNIGTGDSNLPTAGFEWKHTWQPVCPELWDTTHSLMPTRTEWTTVMTWEIESFKDIGGNKDQEFLKVMNLPSQLSGAGDPRLELAINGPMALLREQGWRCVPAFDVSSDLWRYRGYLQSSRGEFSVAKHTYVKWNSGWFSDRTACYLASGRPAVVQDTGFSLHLPCGEGLLAWTTLDEAREALRRVEADYAKHANAARELAHDAFASKSVLTRLLTQCGV